MEDEIHSLQNNVPSVQLRTATAPDNMCQRMILREGQTPSKMERPRNTSRKKKDTVIKEAETQRHRDTGTRRRKLSHALVILTFT